MEKTNHVLKGLGYSYILTLATLLIYNLALTFTSLSGDSIAMASSAITTAGSIVNSIAAAITNPNVCLANPFTVIAPISVHTPSL